MHHRGERKFNLYKSRPIITRILVKNLFGRYNYNLKLKVSNSKSHSDVAILYGDNGMGKTTIFRLLFHLLSPLQGRRHRSLIGRIPVELFRVYFSDKTSFAIRRGKKKLIGSYNIEVKRPSGKLLTGRISIDKEWTVETPLEPRALKVIHELPELGLSIYFLTDDRTIHSDEMYDRPSMADFETQQLERRFVDTPRIAPERQKEVLPEVLSRVTFWLNRKLIQDTSKGDVDAVEIFAQIAERLQKEGQSQSANLLPQKKRILEDLKKIDERSREVAKFKLTSHFHAERFINVLKKAKNDQLQGIVQLISSVVDWQRARLDALEDLYERLERFVEIVNAFLLHKSITVRVRDGLTVTSSTGKTLAPYNLSSGEKQLLLLLCNVLISTDEPSLFIIDEPELSLNVKWQRKLVDVLLRLTEGSGCQFLLASHSIEILAKHDRSVIELRPN